MGTGSLPGVKSGRGVKLTPYHLLMPWSWKGRAIPLLPLWAVRPVQSLSACTRVTFNFTFTFYLIPSRARRENLVAWKWLPFGLWHSVGLHVDADFRRNIVPPFSGLTKIRLSRHISVNHEAGVSALNRKVSVVL